MIYINFTVVLSNLKHDKLLDLTFHHVWHLLCIIWTVVLRFYWSRFTVHCSLYTVHKMLCQTSLYKCFILSGLARKLYLYNLKLLNLRTRLYVTVITTGPLWWFKFLTQWIFSHTLFIWVIYTIWYSWPIVIYPNCYIVIAYWSEMIVFVCLA